MQVSQCMHSKKMPNLHLNEDYMGLCCENGNAYNGQNTTLCIKWKNDKTKCMHVILVSRSAGVGWGEVAIEP